MGYGMYTLIGFSMGYGKYTLIGFIMGLSMTQLVQNLAISQ